ncbi:Cell surface ferroxidase fetC [Hyphodiscus hymeniophilus]|uniref:Cell surface ferroxidase fetC n=1 Tax=Hyphodiscus hymeniophilus TaxID=353542 RepID=A0A9P7AVN7_9HELO|nr:Cell surface ferroxidase fetC [Hyphodiscus hymeniophilus]
MAISLSFFPILSALLLVFSRVSEAATVVYDFNITWVLANPDGAFTRPTIGINNAWPLPIMTATKGDNVIVNVDNQLGNQTTTLHFHGLFMNGTTEMDGPSQVSQCPIPPGSKFTYNFTLTQSGSYWYHSHDTGQYPDGLRAPFIISDPDFPYKFDEELVLSVSDWYHDQMQTLIPQFINRANPTGAEPVPQAALFNDTQNLTVAVEPGKTYLFHVVNIGAFAGQYIWFEGHNLTIVEVDGVFTDQAEAEMIYVGAAQRCSFMITTKNETTANYAFVSSMDTSLFDTIPDTLNWNVTGWLVYDEANANPVPELLDEFNDFDDFTLVPFDKMALLPEPDQVITLDVIMDNLGNGKPYAFFNNITYTRPKVPTLYSVLTTGADSVNSLVYGEFSHSFVLDHLQTIEIVVNNHDSGKHPFHLHGHNFQAIARSEEEAGDFDARNATQTDYPLTPMRRDTFVLYPDGHIVLRFQADNPGVWLFHCHIEWHVDQGLIATMIEAPLELQKSLTIPEDHFDACKAGGVPFTGNAAANTVNYLDLKGANESPKPLPAGFTARGIVALTFSCIAALLGLAVITWYGLADMGAASQESENRRLAQMDRDAARDRSEITEIPSIDRSTYPESTKLFNTLRSHTFKQMADLLPISYHSIGAVTFDFAKQAVSTYLATSSHLEHAVYQIRSASQTMVAFRYIWPIIHDGKPARTPNDRRHFHDYFVTNLPSSSLHPDSRSSSGPHHKLPRSASTPHKEQSGHTPAAAPPMIGASRELTVVRIPLRSAKHHFGVSVSRGTRPYNEDTYQAGTLEIPAFARRAPISLTRAGSKVTGGGGTSADGASGDPQVFYFGVFDGHGGNECSDFLREELHTYLETTAETFELGSSLKNGRKSEGAETSGDSDLSTKRKESLDNIEPKDEEDVKDSAHIPERDENGRILNPPEAPPLESEKPVSADSNKQMVAQMEQSLIAQWKDTVGGYFRRFKPEHFSLVDSSTENPVSIESVLMYSFLKADLDFVTAQARKPDPDNHSDKPLNADDILGEPAHLTPSSHRIGGPTRFVGGSTASIALISTPTPTPFWHPATPSTLIVAHVGDTRILLCNTVTGLANPVTTNHHPSSPIESTRLRRYAATFVTDSFGEERMSGLANTRAFGDMRSKRIGVSAEPEIRRIEIMPAEYSFLVLVSDGVSGTLSDQEIVDVVKEAKTPEQGARDVVGFATELVASQRHFVKISSEWIEDHET